MTRRRKIQLISVIAAALIALIGTTISGYVLAGRYRTDLEYGYRRAFNDLSEHVTRMRNALNKVTYANTPTQQHGITALLMKEASSASAFPLAVLPLGGDSIYGSKIRCSGGGLFLLSFHQDFLRGNLDGR